MNQSVDRTYLLPTSMIDSDHESIIGFARRLIGTSEEDPVAKAVTLYYAVRDGIWYDPYYFICRALSRQQRAQERQRGIASARPLFFALWEEPAESPPGWDLPMSGTIWLQRNFVR
jgi:hypothetical protein